MLEESVGWPTQCPIRSLLIKKDDILSKYFPTTQFIDLRGKLSVIGMTLRLREDIDIKVEKEFELFEE